MQKIAPPSAFKINPVNPRKITADQLARLKRSLQELPQMLELRPVVVDNDHSMTVLGGNMRVHTHPAHPSLISSFARSAKWQQIKKAGQYDPRTKHATSVIGGQNGGRPCATFSYQRSSKA